MARAPMLSRLVAALLALALGSAAPALALAQGVPVHQMGAATPGNIATFGRNGQIIDGGGAIGNIVGPASAAANEVAVWSDTSGKILKRSAGLSLAHSGSLDVSKTAVATTPRGLFSAAAYPQNLFSVIDATVMGTPGFNQPTTIGTAFDMTVPGGFTITNALHTSLTATAKLTGNATYALAGNLESVMGAFFTGDAAANCGGAVSPGASACKVYGGAVAGTLSAGATGFNALTGLEVDASIYAGASADYRVGLLIADINGAIRGTLGDFALSIGRVTGGGGSVGFFYGIDFGGGITGGSGVSADGTLMGSAIAHSVTNLMNFSNVTCSSSALLLQTGSAWNCDGRLLVQTATATPTMTLKTTGAADAMLNITAGAGGQQALINFIEGASTIKWAIGKGADQGWYGWDFVNDDAWHLVTSAGLLILGEDAGGVGAQITLSRAGTSRITNMPTSAGAGGLYVCADTDGALYRKATCP